MGGKRDYRNPQENSCKEELERKQNGAIKKQIPISLIDKIFLSSIYLMIKNNYHEVDTIH